MRLHPPALQHPHKRAIFALASHPARATPGSLQPPAGPRCRSLRARTARPSLDAAAGRPHSLYGRHFAQASADAHESDRAGCAERRQRSLSRGGVECVLTTAFTGFRAF